MAEVRISKAEKKLSLGLRSNALPRTPKMTETERKPRRRVVFIAKIEADDWNRLSDELLHMSREIDRGCMRSTSISGGYSCGHIVVASEDGSMDHDKWFQELKEYLEAERTKGLPAPVEGSPKP
jgi:hypothetical protein